MIAIISATEDEISLFISNLTLTKTSSSGNPKFLEGNFLDIETVVCISGVGTKRAGSAAEKLIKKYKPGIIVSAGFAGALNPRLKLGDIMLSESATSTREPGKINLFTDLPYMASNFVKGAILTDNRFISSRKDKLDLFVKTSADIVDMETWAIAAVARQLGTKVVSVRSVSDITSHELPRMEKIFNRESKIDYKKSFEYFRTNPLDAVKFLKFKYINLRKARIRLNSFLTILVPVLETMNI